MIKLKHNYIKGIWALADQGIISLSNFITTIMIARALDVSVFGIYVLALSVIQFFGNVQVALIIQPMNILGPSKSADEWQRYFSSLVILQIAVSLVCSALFFAGSCFYEPFRRLVYFSAFTILCNQAQELIRRVQYIFGKIRLAVLIDFISYAGQIAMIYFLSARHLLTINLSIFSIGITSFVAVVVLLFTRAARFRFQRPAGSSFRENWSISKWLLSSTLAYWVANQIYPFLTAGLVGIAATGALRATQNIIGITHPILTSVDTYLTPIASRKFVECKKNDFGKFLFKIFRYTAIPFYILLCLIGIFSKQIIAVLYGNSYAAYWPLLVLTCFLYGLLYLNRFLSTALNSMRKTFPAFLTNCLTAIYTVTLGVLFIRSFGVYGSILSSIVNAVFTFGVTAIIFGNSMKTLKRGTGYESIAYR